MNSQKNSTGFYSGQRQVLHDCLVVNLQAFFSISSPKSKTVSSKERLTLAVYTTTQLSPMTAFFNDAKSLPSFFLSRSFYRHLSVHLYYRITEAGKDLWRPSNLIHHSNTLSRIAKPNTSKQGATEYRFKPKSKGAMKQTLSGGLTVSTQALPLFSRSIF